MATSSPLSHDTGEKETEAAWIVRKLAGSMTGRIALSSYESLRAMRAMGTSVICLSPWGDSSPLSLPCVRFRDLAVHTIVVATGGVAAIAAPVMGPVADVVTSTIGDSILVEKAVDKGYEFAYEEGIEKTLKHAIPIHSNRLETTGVRELMITLKFKHIHEDAALGFFRSSVHRNASLFSDIKDYLAVEKGWFSPYLYASARRPVIPRNMKADVVFCHGPFLQGDYRIGETLLSESALVISFCGPSAPILTEDRQASPVGDDSKKSGAHLPKISGFFSRSRTPPPSRGSAQADLVADQKSDHLGVSSLLDRIRGPSPKPVADDSRHTTTQTPGAAPAPVVPRRMVVVLVGLKPHRKLWTTSARPGESVIKYIICNGCPTLVVPVKTGAPLVAWDCLTLEKLWELELPPNLPEASKERASVVVEGAGKFEGVVKVIYEFLDLCVDWERAEVGIEGGSGMNKGGDPHDGNTTDPKSALKKAIWLLLAAAVRTQDSKEVKKEIDAERCGIAMWRIP